MTDDWTILHAGALGDLALAIQLALRAGLARRSGGLMIVSRTNPGDLSQCNPAILRRSIEGLKTHWLHADDDDPPPESLRGFFGGRRVLSFLGPPASRVHARLLQCGCRRVLSIDPATRESDRHILDQWRAQLESQGFLFPKCSRNQAVPECVHAPEALRNAGLRRFRDAGVKGAAQILIHPGSGSAAKCWPLANFQALAELLIRANRQVAWIIGPVELERWPASHIHSLGSTAPVMNLEQTSALLELLACSSLLVANDSGPGHLAALLGTPVVSIFGPTDSRVWKPAGPRCVVFQGSPATAQHWGVNTSSVSELVLSLPKSPQ